jgi:phosphoglycerol transferase MdoB-like AlkP superfamily enzyme
MRKVSLLFLFLLATAVSAAAPRFRGSHAFTLLSGGAPRVVVADRELDVRLSLRNDGAVPLDPAAQYRLSYHWFDLRGVPLVLDSVRTELPRVIEPRQSITLDGHLGTPPTPGIYLLQWDVVQEGVTWFSQRDPAPPGRTIVFVVPAGMSVARALCEVSPSLVVLIGLALILGRRRREPRGRVFAVLGVLDLVWCTTSLFPKQLLLLMETHLDVTAGAILASASTAAFVPVLLLFFLPRRHRAWAAWAVAAAGSVVLLADVVYFRYFGDVLSSAALLASGQAGRLEASVRSLLAARDVWLVADLFVALPLVVVLTRLPDVSLRARRAQRAVAVLGLLVLLVSGVRTPALARLEKGSFDVVFRNLNVVEDLGAFGFHADDAWGYLRAKVFRPPLSEAQMDDVREWFARRAPQRAGVGPWFGAARGRNVILILVESLQGFVVGLRVNGQEVTPHLNRLRDESVWSSRVVDQVGEGRTSDAEVINAVSLLPPGHGAAAFRYPADHFVAVPALLGGRGYHTVSAVAFDATFWNRRVMHPAFGFTRSFFAPDFGPGERIGWGLNDRDFLRQMAPRLAALPKPFYAWLITLSLHHPFDSFPEAHKTLDLGPWKDTQLANYLHAMHFFDAGLGDFVEGLKQARLLNDTVLVVEGDHEAGVLWDEVSRAAGFHHDELDWYLADRVPLVIRVPGERAPRQEITLEAGQTDVAPTVLALLGVDPAPLPYVGRNLLGQPGDGPVVRRYGDWVDGKHLFLAGQGYTSQPGCWDLQTRAAVPVAACQEGQAAAARELDVSWRVLTYDLQQRLVAAHPPGK